MKVSLLHSSHFHFCFCFRVRWQVELGPITTVSKVVVWDRTDCCKNRLSHFDVYVDSTKCGSVAKAKRTNTVRCGKTGKTGQKVKVQLQGKDYLTLAEVEVYGMKASEKARKAYSTKATAAAKKAAKQAAKKAKDEAAKAKKDAARASEAAAMVMCICTNASASACMRGYRLSACGYA